TPLYSDTIPPTSKITSPIDGLTISVGEKYAIQGTAQDQGGSTVQKVEVSLKSMVLLFQSFQLWKS
ncbi:MAG: Ig-like domain-containing protein, partial [Nanoarchaeota archaeon]